MKWNVHIKNFHFIVNYRGCLKKSTWVIEMQTELVTLFMKKPFLLERLTDEQNQSYSESTF